MPRRSAPGRRPASPLRVTLAGVGVGKRPRDPGAAPVAQLPLAAVLAAVAAVVALTAVDDDGHVRVVLVVLDHPVEEVRLELAWDDAVDHRSLSLGVRRD